MRNRYSTPDRESFESQVGDFLIYQRFYGDSQTVHKWVLYYKTCPQGYLKKFCSKEEALAYIEEDRNRQQAEKDKVDQIVQVNTLADQRDRDIAVREFLKAQVHRSPREIQKEKQRGESATERQWAATMKRRYPNGSDSQFGDSWE